MATPTDFIYITALLMAMACAVIGVAVLHAL
jgi:hypothetical protein